jgi:periplasmic protein TonB
MAAPQVVRGAVVMSYGEQRRAQKPVSIAAAVALNGSIIAAIMLSPLVVSPREKPPTIVATNVRPPVIPPDVIDPQKDQIKPLPDIYVPTTDLPVDPPIDQVDTTTKRPENTGGFAQGKGGGDDIGDFVKPPEVIVPPPLFVRAKRDSQFAKDFQPDYPNMLLLRGIEGTATVRVLIGTDGRVRQANVVSASHPDFGKAAVRQALKAWRFKPATRGGVAVEDWQTIPVSFVIN